MEVSEVERTGMPGIYRADTEDGRGMTFEGRGEKCRAGTVWAIQI